MLAHLCAIVENLAAEFAERPNIRGRRKQAFRQSLGRRPPQRNHTHHRRIVIRVLAAHLARQAKVRDLQKKSEKLIPVTGNKHKGRLKKNLADVVGANEDIAR